MKTNSLTFEFGKTGYRVSGVADREQIVEMAVWCIREYIRTADAVEEVDALNSLLTDVEADAVIEFLNEDGGYNDEGIN